VADRTGNRALGALVRTALVLASVVLVAAACSSGSAATSATSAAPPGSGAASGGTGGTGSKPGDGGSGPGGSTSTTDPKATTSPAAGGRNAGGSKATGGTNGNGKGTGDKSSGGKGGASAATTTTVGIPPLKQQFSADDATFRSAMSSAQKALVRLPATITPQQVAAKLLPLLVAANAYQSQMVNLPWSSSVKPLAQSLTQSVGQLTAVLEQIQRPGAFFSVRQLRTALSSAQTSVRSASTAVSNALGLS
jgi:hypothetical protein